MKRFLWRHKALLVIWVAVFGIGGYTGYILFIKSSGNENPYVLSNSSDKSSDSQKDVTDQPKQIAIGEPATDGDLEFTVKGINCDDDSVGTNQYAMDEAEGKFCKLRVNITNKAAEARSLLVSKQKLYIGDNAYPLDETATQYAQADQSIGIWHQNIAPGATMTGELVFDVPASMNPTKAILYAGEGSGGIEVSL